MLLYSSQCHDNVIKAIDFGGSSQKLQVSMDGVQYKMKGFFYLVFPMMPLGSLLNLLMKANEKKSRLSNEARRYLCASFIRNLSVLTKNGISHCDMKPDNIVLVQDENGLIGTALIDFGSACASEELVS